MSDFLGIIGVVIGFVGLIYAWYSNKEKAKVEKFIQAAGWDLYTKASNQNAHVQLAMDAVLKSENKDQDIINNLSKADAFGQYMTRDTIKLIHHVEPKFNEDMIKKWVETERVSDGHKVLFMGLTPSSDTKYKHRSKETNKS